MSTAVTEQSFEQEVLQSDKPVIVDFWAEWCGPCHAVSPVLDKIVDERNGDLKLVKVNIDEEQGLAMRFGVQSIPMMILFKEGQPTAAAVGAQPKTALEKALGLADEVRGRGGYAPSARFLFRVRLRRDRPLGRLVGKTEHAHPVHVDDRAAEPASQGQEPEPDQRQHDTRRADVPARVRVVAEDRGERRTTRWR